MTDMVEELEKFGGNIKCDSYVTSMSLGCQLLSKRFTIERAMMKNKGGIPLELTSVKTREHNTTLFGFQKDSMVLLYCPKKEKMQFY